MIALLTTCTAEKDPREALLAAQLRYRGARVEHAAQRAEVDGMPLLFLSGVFGVISADHPIPWYDHALLPGEVEARIPLVVGQLSDLGVVTLEALLAPADTPGWAPYHRLLTAGCRAAGVRLRVVITELG